MSKPQELWFVGKSASNLDRWRLADANGMGDVTSVPFETPRAALAVATREAHSKHLRITSVMHSAQSQEFLLLLTPIDSD